MDTDNKIAVKVVDIVAVFDTEAIIAKYGTSGTKDHPTGIGHSTNDPSQNVIFMIANEGDLENPKTQASPNLAVKAFTNEIIRWRAESLSGNSQLSVIFYDIAHNTGAQVMSKPQQHVVQTAFPVPTQSDPTKYEKVVEPDVFWQATFENPGTEQYKLYFYIVEYSRGTFTTVGYYWWDPSVTAFV